jgi:hypothetical protein
MKRKVTIGFGVIILVALLAGAAYVIPRLASGRLTNLVAAIPGLSAANKDGEIDVKLIPASQLPPHPPDWVGTVASTRDNSIFATPRNGGAAIEIVTNKDTLLWQDDNGIIRKEIPSAGNSAGTVHVQESVQAIAISQVLANDDILIWGEQRGDRFIASTVLLRGMVAAKNVTPSEDK